MKDIITAAYKEKYGECPQKGYRGIADCAAWTAKLVEFTAGAEWMQEFILEENEAGKRIILEMMEEKELLHTDNICLGEIFDWLEEEA